MSDNYYEVEPGFEDVPDPSAETFSWDEDPVVEEEVAPAPAPSSGTKVKCVGLGTVEVDGNQYRPGNEYDVSAADASLLLEYRDRRNKQRFYEV